MNDKIIYINAPEPFGEHTQTIKLNSWQVVNAPRPLPGAIEWIGEFRHGIFYAAGDFKVYGIEWVNLDAWPIKEISNIEIIETLRKQAEEVGEDLWEIAKGYSMEKLASDAGLPWR